MQTHLERAAALICYTAASAAGAKVEYKDFLPSQAQQPISLEEAMQKWK